MINNLKKIREELGLTRYKLSKDTKISYSFLTEVEQQLKGVSFAKADKIASYLGYPLEEIFPKFAKRISPLPNSTTNKLN